MDTMRESHQRGQGLVEYALILVLVAVVVIAVLTLLGPQVGNVFSRVNAGLGVATGSGGGGGGGGSTATVTNASTQTHLGTIVTLNVTVSENTSITLTDDVSGNSKTVTCNGSCNPTLDVGHTNSGNITVTAPANSRTVFYPPSP